MNKKKLIKLSKRLILLLLSLYFTTIYPNETIKFFNLSIFNIKIYHIIWVYICLVIILPLFPKFNKGNRVWKCFGNNFQPIQYDLIDKSLIRNEIIKANRSEIKVTIFWLFLLVIPWILYFIGLISKLGIYNAFFVFFLLDMIAILYWCPFRDWLVKNRCCNDCIINKWGYLMVTSVLIYIPSFWTYSVIFLASLNLIQWEWLRYKYPKRFSPLFNKTLRCKGQKCDFIEFCPKWVKQINWN